MATMESARRGSATLPLLVDDSWEPAADQPGRRTSPEAPRRCSTVDAVIETHTTIIRDALGYAAQGLRVIPLWARGETPCIERWPDRGTTEPATIMG